MLGLRRDVSAPVGPAENSHKHNLSFPRSIKASFWSPSPLRSHTWNRALSDGRCNLVQLSSKITPFVEMDEKGNPVERDPESPDDSWEARVFGNDSVRVNENN